jgi:hypothetical protein
MEKPASTWSFDQGTLTVHHLGKTVSLGRYATREFAAKAAAAYFAKLLLAAIMKCGCCESRRGLHSCTSEKEALGFAVCKLRCGHAVQEISERAGSKLFDRADTAAIEATSVNRRVRQPLTWAYQWPGG